MSVNTCLIYRCLSSASAVIHSWFIYELQKSTTIAFSRSSLYTFYSRHPTCGILPCLRISNCKYPPCPCEAPPPLPFKNPKSRLWYSMDIFWNRPIDTLSVLYIPLSTLQEVDSLHRIKYWKVNRCQNPPPKIWKRFCFSKETIANTSNTVSWLSVRWLLLYRISLGFSTFNGQVNFMFRRSTLDKCPSNGWVKHKKIPWDTNPYHWYATRVIE